MVVFQKFEGKTSILKFCIQKYEGKTTTLQTLGCGAHVRAEVCAEMVWNCACGHIFDLRCAIALFTLMY